MVESNIEGFSAVHIGHVRRRAPLSVHQFQTGVRPRCASLEFFWHSAAIDCSGFSVVGLQIAKDFLILCRRSGRRQYCLVGLNERQSVVDADRSAGRGR